MNNPWRPITGMGPFWRAMSAPILFRRAVKFAIVECNVTIRALPRHAERFRVSKPFVTLRATIAKWRGGFGARGVQMRL